MKLKKGESKMAVCQGVLVLSWVRCKRFLSNVRLSGTLQSNGEKKEKK